MPAHHDPPVRACSIIARNYWAHARVLARSLRAQHPDAELSVLVLDGDAVSDADEPFRVVLPSDLSIDRHEFHRMAAIYDVLELATAIKPWLLSHLLDIDDGPVLYFDPDIEFFAPVDVASELAAEHDLVLLPHVLSPPPLDHRTPDEITFLKSGVFNLGFVAVGQNSRPFLEWWSERLARDCLSAVTEGMFVDQRWMDLAPAYFDHHILRDPGWNVAYWNLPARRIEMGDDGLLVDGRPLRFFHYSGFDPHRPDALSRYVGPRPRLELADDPVLHRLCHDYARALVSGGYRTYSQVPYGFGRTPVGMRLDRRARRLYRRHLIDAERGDASEPPNPFDEPGGFLDWLREPVGPHGVTRYLRELYDTRPEVGAAFPDIDGSDARLFCEWVRTSGAVEAEIPPALVPGSLEERTPGAHGVNVAGYLRAESGVGEGARALLTALDAAGIESCSVPYTNTRSRQQADVAAGRIREPVHGTSIVCVNADELPGFRERHPEVFEGRYTIGMWAWEVERLPAGLARSTELVDEIWLGSEHAAKAVRPHTSKPVHVFPLPIVPPRHAPVDRAELGLPDGFLFLFCFDFDSVFERKNPVGVIDAFDRAFVPGSGPQLVIKTVRGEAHPDELTLLRDVAAKRPDVHILDGYLDRDRHNAVVASCDAYVSLHRAEGFGLTLAEAMALGKPTVGTGYSGNLEFMNEANSYLVRHELVPIPDGCGPYPAGARWADPDTEHAATILRSIVEDTEASAHRGRRAADDIAALHSPQARSAFLLERLSERWMPALVGSLPSDPFSETEMETADRAWSPIRSAEHYLQTGPELGSPTRYGALSKSARKLILRGMRHYAEHQDRVQAALLEGLREVVEHLGAEAAAVREAEDRLRAGDLRLDDQSHQTAELRRKLAWISKEIEATAFTSDPESVTTVDPWGRKTIGFDEPSAGSADDRYRLFEEVFRGTEEEIRDAQRTYVDILTGATPVLDVGCGRGEMLDLLREEGIDASGVDLDPGMVERCRAKGLRVNGGDGLSHLEDLPDGSLGAIFAAQVIEHFETDDLWRFLELARAKLRSGGTLIAETINPYSLRALRVFWVDPTHVRPIYPEVLTTMCRLVGFDSGYVLFPNGSGELDVDRTTNGAYAVVASAPNDRG